MTRYPSEIAWALGTNHMTLLAKPAVLLRLPLLFVLAGTLAAQTESTWSRFRGPNGTGIAETGGLPVEFGPEKNVVWKTGLPTGYSSPVLSKEHIFLTSFEEEELLTYCLDRGTGEIVWRRSISRTRAARLDPRNNPASATPVVDGDTVVVFFEDFGMVAYDHGGDERWRLPLGPFDNEYGMGASPVLVGDKVFLACDQSTDSFLIAVSKVNGEIAWKVDRPQATSGHCTPIVYQPDSGALQLILPGSFFLDAYDTETGERVWWVGGLCFEMKSVPALHDGVIYINGYGTPMNDPGNQIQIPAFAEVQDVDGDGAISRSEMPRSRASGFFSFMDLDKDGALDETEWSYLRAAMASQNGLLAIKAGGKGDMTDDSVLWAYRRTVPQLPSPLVYGGALYVLHDQGGLITTLDPKSGDVIERGRLSGAVDNYFASPVGADGKVYMVSQNGLVSVLEAGGSLESLALNDLDELCYATPAIADGRIYLRTGSALYCFGME